MSGSPRKHDRDQSLKFKGFLNNIQDWEHSRTYKENMLKSQAHGKEMPIGLGERKNSAGNASSLDFSGVKSGKRDYSGNYDSMTHTSNPFMNEENSPDAVSEKELGNEYFKQKKFKEAIDCYSRSIIFSPTSVAYANRAMAFIKIKRFQDAENDCTEALNLDDRYIKAYSRRATARKELRKLKESIEDSEFALRLEPQNEEIKKLHAETKSMYHKEIYKKTSDSLGGSVHGTSSSNRFHTDAKQIDHSKDGDVRSPMKASMFVEELESKDMDIRNSDVVQVNGLHNSSVQSSKLISQKTNTKDLEASMQQLASRAASETTKNIMPPNSAYQFEASWRALSGDFAMQASLLKSVSPNALPQIFKNALSAPILMGIVKCIAFFFSEETDLGFKYLESLTKVARFDMILMCLSPSDKSDMVKLWDEVFCSKGGGRYADAAAQLRPKFWPDFSAPVDPCDHPSHP